MLLSKPGEYITWRVDWPFHESSGIAEYHELADTSVNIITFGVSQKLMKTDLYIMIQLINVMELRPSWEATCCAAPNELPSIL
jgi:hypothetical protein